MFGRHAKDVKGSQRSFGSGGADTCLGSHSEGRLGLRFEFRCLGPPSPLEALPKSSKPGP